MRFFELVECLLGVNMSRRVNRVQLAAWDAQTQVDARDLGGISRTVGKNNTRLIVGWYLLWHLWGGVVVVGRTGLVVVHGAARQIRRTTGNRVQEFGARLGQREQIVPPTSIGRGLLRCR